MATHDAGRLIRERREALGLRQEDLAARLNVSQSLVSQWERGKARPSDQMQELAAVLETSMWELFDQQVGWSNEVEQAIAKDRLLRSRREQDALLAAYGALTGRDSVKNVLILRTEDRVKEHAEAGDEGGAASA